MAADNLKSIKEYPEISFIDNYTISQLEDDMLGWFKEKKKELTGEDVTLAKADDRKLLLSACAYYIFQGYMFLDDMGKMNLLKYSRGDYLENLGALKRISRNPAKESTTTIRFEMKSARATTTGIPMGTRLTAGDGVFFSTLEYAEITIGELQAEVTARCMTAGAAGNEYDIGDIKTIVDPVPYIDIAKNITKPENGADEEDDESLRQRIYIAPASYSTAGPEDSYEYYVREYNPDIVNVRIISPVPGEVHIRYLLDDGMIPGDESIQGLQDYLEQKEIRPLTDNVHVMAPDIATYDMNVTYYINQSDKNRSNAIQQNVNLAIAEYEMWQKTEIGRDINPDVLLEKIIGAGAKRAVIQSPVFTVIGDDSVANINSKTVTYGGLEYD